MKKLFSKIIASILTVVITIGAIPISAFAIDDANNISTIGYARKSQFVLFSSGDNAMQLNTTKTTVNGNLYSGCNLDAYSGEVDVRGRVHLGGELKKHDHTIWNSYLFEENSDKMELNDFSAAVTEALGNDCITHEYWQTYSNPEIENEKNIYAKSGLQFCGTDVTLNGTIISDNYLMISASHALSTGVNGELNLYVADGNIGIYVGDATINGVIYAPNGTVQICGSDIEINGMIIAKEVLISADNFVINENSNLSLAPYIKNYSDQTLTAHADYDVETKMFNVDLFSTMKYGTYSIYTSFDGENYNLSGITDEITYSFGIDENYPTLYIKATQTLDNGAILVSNIIKMIAYEKYGYIMEQTDTDSDGLTDFLEQFFGSNKNIADTDNDGLSDFIEVMIVGTDPLYIDTDEDGVEDGDEDYDGDGLTNLQEVGYGTNLNNSDTDNDRLTDYEEVFVYGTDPLKADSDGDGVKDGDEIELGLDPFLPDSNGNGIPDNMKTFAQCVDNSDLDTINAHNPYKLTIEINAAGYANNTMKIDESEFSYIADTNNAVLGRAFEIDYDENLKVGSIVLKFEIPQNIVNSTRNYPESNELAGLNRYAIFHYNKKYNIMHPVSVEYDNTSSLLKLTADELGDYFVVDLDQWFFDMGVEPDQYQKENEVSTFSLDKTGDECYNEESKQYSNEELRQIFDIDEGFFCKEIDDKNESITNYIAPILYAESEFSTDEKIKPVDIVFILDCTDNLKDNFENSKENIILASEKIYEVCDSARVNVIQFWAGKTPIQSGWFTNSQINELKRHVNSIAQSMNIGNSLYGEALMTAANLEYRSDAEIFNFLIFDEYSQWSANMTNEEIVNGIQKIINNSINFSVLTNPSRAGLGNNLNNLISISNGYKGTNIGGFGTQVAQHVYNNTDKISIEPSKPTEPSEPSKPSEPENFYYVDVSGPVVLSDFTTKDKYVNISTIYNGQVFNNTIIKDSESDYDKDGITDSDEVYWDGLAKRGYEYKCRTFNEWMNEILDLPTWGLSPMLLRAKVLTVTSNPFEADKVDSGAGGKIPGYVFSAIDFSGLLKQNKHLKNACIRVLNRGEDFVRYATSQYKYDEWFSTYTAYSAFVIEYYDEKEAARVLEKLTNNKELAKFLLSNADDLSNVLTDPGFPIEDPFTLGVAFIANIYSLARSIGWINDDTTTVEVLDNYIHLYKVADGKTPLCVNATLYVWGDNREWYEKGTYHKGY